MIVAAVMEGICRHTAVVEVFKLGENIAGNEPAFDLDAAVGLFQKQLQDAGVVAQILLLVGDEIAHGVDHRHLLAVFGGDGVAHLQAMGMAAYDVVNACVGKDLGLFQLLVNGVVHIFLAPVGIAEDELSAPFLGPGYIRIDLFRGELVQHFLTQGGEVGFQLVEPVGVGNNAHTDAAHIHQGGTVGLTGQEGAGVEEAVVIQPLQGLDQTQSAGVAIVIVGIGHTVEACVAQGIQEAFGGVAVVLAGHRVELACIGGHVGNGGFQIADHHVRLPQNGAHEPEEGMKENGVAIPVGADQPGLTDQIAGAADKGFAVFRGGGIFPPAVTLPEEPGDILFAIVIPGVGHGIGRFQSTGFLHLLVSQTEHITPPFVTLYHTS